jgi:ABC-type multidrug transport system ATPase subunit/ABC-type multidrug transport system permease subunit
MLVGGGAPPPTQRIGVSQQQPQLLIQEPGLVARTVALTAFPVYIGSDPGPGCVQVSHPAVTRQHAELSERGGDFWVTDLGSANGAILNGRRLPAHTPQRLIDGDILRVGDAQGNSVGITFRCGGAPFPTISKQLGKLQLGQTGVLTLGRDPSNDVHLDHPMVSRFHAEVRRTAQGDVLTDRSANGTFVNGQRVRGQHQLAIGAVVQIGPFKLTYDQTAFTQVTPAGSYRLDAVRLMRRVNIGNTPLTLLRGGSGQTVKLILNDVNLSIYPREFVALVGGSGAGKSTLMKALSGFTPAEGEVLLNGDNLYRNFGAYRSILGYVPQDDIIHRHLTVRSALVYAARLRLPDATPMELEQRVTAVLDQVEMTAHAAKLVSQLSGGQRKRVSIAAELLADPGVFFLDEPTSGLDPGLEKKMMHTLRQLADAGRTIVLVTHATANIDQCDHVAFMADGNLAYYGPPGDALAFFSARDFADIYTKLTQPIDPLRNPAPAQWQPPLVAPGAPAPSTLPASSVWATCYQASPQHRKFVADRLQNTPPPTSATPATVGSSKQKDSAWRQYLVLTQRYAELTRRDVVSMVTLLAVMPLIGLLLLVMANRADLTGLTSAEIYAEVQAEIDDAWNAEDDPASDNDQFQGAYQVAGASQTLLFMLALAANLLGVFGASYEIVREEGVYQRERMVNLKLGPYLFSKISVLGVFALVQCALLLWVVGRRVDYPENGILLPAWLELYITLVLASLAGITLGLLLSAVVRSQSTVIYLILLVLFVQIMFAGAIFELPAGATPISYLTPTRWTLEALGSTVDMPRLNELSVTCVEPEDEMQRQMMGEVDAPCEEGQQRLSPKLEFNVDYAHDSAHLLSRWVVLLLLAGAFGGLTYVVQKRKDVI